MTNLANEMPTVGEYIDKVNETNASLNLGALFGALTCAVGIVTKVVLDKKSAKLQKEIDQLTEFNNQKQKENEK